MTEFWYDERNETGTVCITRLDDQWYEVRAQRYGMRTLFTVTMGEHLCIQTRMHNVIANLSFRYTKVKGVPSTSVLPYGSRWELWREQDQPNQRVYQHVGTIEEVRTLIDRWRADPRAVLVEGML